MLNRSKTNLLIKRLSRKSPIREKASVGLNRLRESWKHSWEEIDFSCVCQNILKYGWTMTDICMRVCPCICVHVHTNAHKKTSHRADCNALQQSESLESLKPIKQMVKHGSWNLTCLLLTIAWGPMEGGRQHVQRRRTRRKKSLETNTQVSLWEDQQHSPYYSVLANPNYYTVDATAEVHLYTFRMWHANKSFLKEKIGWL